MKTTSEHLISNLIEHSRKNLNAAEKMKTYSLEQLNHKPAPGSWSALEAIEHLNLYGDYYLPEIANRINESKTTAEVYFKPGMLGDYFAKIMIPGEKSKKMKTFKDKDPAGSKLDKSCLDRFIQQQKQMLQLLDKSRKVSLNKTKTSISIAPLLKLKLGDTFRVVIYHNDRHVLQAQKALMIAPVEAM